MYRQPAKPDTKRLQAGSAANAKTAPRTSQPSDEPYRSLYRTHKHIYKKRTSTHQQQQQPSRGKGPANRRGFPRKGAPQGGH